MWRRGVWVAALLALSVAALVGWLSLVLVAVDAATSSTTEEPDWRLAGLATLGAIVLLLLTMVLVRRLLLALRVIRRGDAPPPARHSR